MNIAESSTARRDAITFVVCLVLAVIARADPVGISPSIASGLRETVLVPFIYLQDQTQKVRDRRAEFDRVVLERDSLVMAAGEVEVVRSENVRLRAALALSRRLTFDHVAAEVLHQTGPSDISTVLVSAGTRDGVRVWSPVISPQGLVGYVFQADESVSVVYTWTRGDFRASAVALGPNINGIIAPRAGDGPVTTMELREVAHGAELVEGTPVVTAGLGGIYPRGLPVGTVGTLLEEREGLSKTYSIVPAVRPALVSHVLILIADSTAGADLSPLFVEPVP